MRRFKNFMMKWSLPVLGVLFIVTLTFGDITSPPSSGDVTKRRCSRSAKLDTADIIAVVARSWIGGKQAADFWDNLNTNWEDYGEISISIDYNYPGVSSDSIILDSLRACSADVVILSNPAGGREQYTSDEIDAIQTYAQEGHDVIGTYLLFQWDDIDNRGLADIFGLDSLIDYNTGVVAVTPTFTILEPENPLFNNIDSTYVSAGYDETQVPDDDNSWDDGDLNGARYVAKTEDSKASKAVITVYDASAYTAIYITTMPEHQGDTTDCQFFYNAITYGFTGVAEDIKPNIHNVKLEIYPNPFTAVVSVKCLGIREEQKISLEVYDLSGRLVKTLNTEHWTPGTAVSWDASDYPAGVYFVKLSAAAFSKTQKLILLR